MTEFLRQRNCHSACLALATLLALIGSPTAHAGTVVWANNASLGGPHIQAYDLDTGQNLADFAAPNPEATKGKSNGRGIAVVGQTICCIDASGLH